MDEPVSKEASSNFFSTCKIICTIICCALAVVGFVGGLIFQSHILDNSTDPINNSVQNTAKNNHHYFNDRIVLSGFDTEGQPFLLELDMNRKQEEDGEYNHYYFADVLYKNKTHSQTFSIHEDEPNVHSVGVDNGNGLMISQFENTPAPDLSSRESYELDLSVDDLSISISADGFEGDFLVKNNIDYTKYYSVGEAEVRINGVEFTTHAMASKTYSQDFRSYIFFEGYGELRAEARQFVLWDEQGTFYLIDQTIAEKDLPAYKSHMWGLKKYSDGMMSKSFDYQVTDQYKDGQANLAWSIGTADATSGSLELEKIYDFGSALSSGFVRGTVLSSKGDKFEVQGLGHFRDI